MGGIILVNEASLPKLR